VRITSLDSAGCAISPSSVTSVGPDSASSEDPRLLSPVWSVFQQARCRPTVFST
jgi:hypothetical protein